MIISAKIRNSWKLILEHGDIEHIVKSTMTPEKPRGISRSTITNAIRTGVTSETTFEIIQKFCREKKQKQLQFVKENTIPTDDDNN